MNQRNTGRTTRMLAEAKRFAAAGMKVYVVVIGYAQVSEAQGDCPGVQFIESTAPSLDLQELRMRGVQELHAVLVDHSVIEVKFGKLFNMLHRYDA